MAGRTIRNMTSEIAMSVGGPPLEAGKHSQQQAVLTPHFYPVVAPPHWQDQHQFAKPIADQGRLQENQLVDPSRNLATPLAKELELASIQLNEHPVSDLTRALAARVQDFRFRHPVNLR